MDIVGYITKLQVNVFQIRNDDDFADRLNYRYSVAILVAFAIIVTNRQFSESVIKCWVPAHFTSNYETYANQVCWISNTYHTNVTQSLPKDDDERRKSEIKYYQWIPFILLIQALCLYVPRIIWRLLSTRAGIELKDIMEAACSYKSVEKYDVKLKINQYIVDNIDQYLSNKRRLKQIYSTKQKIKYYIDSFFCGAGIYLGNYLSTTYIFTKILYIINSCLQFYLMNEFIGRNFFDLSISMIKNLFTRQNIHTMLESVYFPKVVMCDFRIREFGHPNYSHRYSVQCVLPINLYNQQIFTFLWFWFVILIFVNIYALGIWSYHFIPKQRKIYIKKRLKLLNKYQKLLYNKDDPTLKQHIQATMKDFNNIYLKSDGFFIIKLISILSSDIVGTQILHDLWRRRRNHKKTELNNESIYKQIHEANNNNNDNGNDKSKNLNTNTYHDIKRSSIREENEEELRKENQNIDEISVIDTNEINKQQTVSNIKKNETITSIDKIKKGVVFATNFETYIDENKSNEQSNKTINKIDL